MDQRSRSTLRQIVRDSSLALFASSAVALSEGAIAVDDPEELGAFVGFTGTALRGALLFISTRELIGKSYPSPVELQDDQLADWTCELTNQLLGRIKNRLIDYGVRIELTIPTALFGRHLERRGSMRGGLAERWTFRHGGDPVIVYLDAMFDPSIELHELVALDNTAFREGELSLF